MGTPCIRKEQKWKTRKEQSEYDMVIVHSSMYKSVNMKSNGNKVTCWETQIVFKWASLEPSIITETTENLFPIGKVTKKIHIFNKQRREFHFWLIFVHMIACLLVWSTREGGHPIILPNHPSVGALSDELHIYHMGHQDHQSQFNWSFPKYDPSPTRASAASDTFMRQLNRPLLCSALFSHNGHLGSQWSKKTTHPQTVELDRCGSFWRHLFYIFHQPTSPPAVHYCISKSLASAKQVQWVSSPGLCCSFLPH